MSSNWRDVYREFEDIVESVDVGPMMSTDIEKQIDALYEQHKGEPAWDEAYHRWCETRNEMEE